MRRKLLVTIAVLGFAGLITPSASAFHFYRGPAGGCTPLDGPTGAAVAPAATIHMLHNTFNDAATALPVTVINAGEAVTWEWNSSHCHSVQAGDGSFYSGFHYPTAPPESTRAVPGFFEYPLPDFTPTLTFTRVFNTGTVRNFV